MTIEDLVMKFMDQKIGSSKVGDLWLRLLRTDVEVVKGIITSVSIITAVLKSPFGKPVRRKRK